MTGRTVSHYEILERLGSGGMGEIYRARDTQLNRMVAIKVLPKSDSSDQTPRLRFMQEARAASGLSHPNIVTVHEVLVDDGSDLMVMELVAGKTIAQLVAGTGLPIPLAIRYAVQIASALAAAHTAGIVHRDIKPGNIMVTATGLVKVLDFGLAKPTYMGLGDDTAKTASISGPLTVKGTVVGTVNYMSPEQAEGKLVDGRSDIFSFGILLYEMVTGRRAFPGESAIATMTAILRDEVRPMREFAPAVPVRLQEIVDKCLRKNRDERWQTTDELLAALENLKMQFDTGSAATMAMPVVPAKSESMPWVVLAAVAVAVVIACGTWWAVVHYWPQRTVPPLPAVAAPLTPPSAPPVPPPAAADNALTNYAVLQMLEAKVSCAVIIDQVRSSKTQFDLSTAAVIKLSQAGASDQLIQAMRDASKPAGARPAASVPAPVPSKPGAAAPVAPNPATPPPPEAAAKTVVIGDGVPVTIELAEDIPANARAGAPLKFTVVNDVAVGGQVAISKGAQVAGQVAAEARKKVLVLETKMTFQLGQADAAGGQKVRVRATPSPGGAGSGRRAVDSGTYAGAKKPKDVAAVAGTQFVVYVDGSQTVNVGK